MQSQRKEEFKRHLALLYKHLKQNLPIKEDPKVKLVRDKENARKILGRTAFYDPDEKSVSLYTEERHPKDILRSFSHECVHHYQNETGKLNTTGEGARDPKYAQNDEVLREAEREAYERGNLLFRDWEDNLKSE